MGHFSSTEMAVWTMSNCFDLWFFGRTQILHFDNARCNSEPAPNVSPIYVAMQMGARRQRRFSPVDVVFCEPSIAGADHLNRTESVGKRLCLLPATNRLPHLFICAASIRSKVNG